MSENEHNIADKYFEKRIKPFKSTIPPKPRKSKVQIGDQNSTHAQADSAPLYRAMDKTRK
jgi:hypothetical protein